MVTHDNDFSLPLTNSLIMSRTSHDVLVINLALIHPRRKPMDILIVGTFLNLKTFVFKLNSLRPLHDRTIIVKTKLHQFFKLDSILNNCHVSLIKPNEFNLLLATHILRKVLLYELCSKHNTIDLSTNNL